jgi:hypothetical protein
MDKQLLPHAVDSIDPMASGYLMAIELQDIYCFRILGANI